jgi:CRP-like cAMP-binding protein
VTALQAVPKGTHETIHPRKSTGLLLQCLRVPGVSPQTRRQSLRGNHIRAAMPKTELQRWEPQLELVDMPLGQVVFEPGGELHYAYFPLTAIVSLLYVMDNGESAEIALVGNDGVLGVTVLMGGNSTTIRAVVQSAGQGWRLPARELEAEVRRGGATLRVLLLYTQALLTQMTQTAACNRHHTLNQQFCRWLLMSFDRLGGDEMVMTQKLIAKMLGVKAEEVTGSAQALQASGAITYDDGRIRLLDRTALLSASCECYEVVRRECERLLPRPLGKVIARHDKLEAVANK